jgi:hypothetical protein
VTFPPEAPNTTNVTLLTPVGTVQTNFPWVAKVASVVLVALAVAPVTCNPISPPAMSKRAATRPMMRRGRRSR